MNYFISCSCEAAAAVPSGAGEVALGIIAFGSLIFVVYYIITRWDTEEEGIS